MSDFIELENLRPYVVKVNATLGARRIGCAIAKSDNDIQAAFFEGLAEGFQEFSEGDKDGYQMFLIRDSITQNTKSFILKLAHYIEPEGE